MSINTCTGTWTMDRSPGKAYTHLAVPNGTRYLVLTYTDPQCLKTPDRASTERCMHVRVPWRVLYTLYVREGSSIGLLNQGGYIGHTGVERGIKCVPMHWHGVTASGKQNRHDRAAQYPALYCSPVPCNPVSPSGSQTRDRASTERCMHIHVP